MNARSPYRVGMLAALVASLMIVAVASPAGASIAAGRLKLSGSVNGTVSLVRAVCNSPVAIAKHAFFFDLGGTSGGKTFLLTATVAHYTRPKTYTGFTGLIEISGRIFTGHATGSVTIGPGSKSATLRMTMKTPPAAPAGTATIAGAFSCTATTNA